MISYNDKDPTQGKQLLHSWEQFIYYIPSFLINSSIYLANIRYLMQYLTNCFDAVRMKNGKNS